MTFEFGLATAYLGSLRRGEAGPLTDAAGRDLAALYRRRRASGRS